MDQEQPLSERKLQEEDKETITSKMETDERDALEEKSLSEMQIVPKDPCTAIINEIDETKRIVSTVKDEQEITLAPALVRSNDIENYVVMEPAETEGSTHPQTANDSQVSNPNTFKTATEQCVAGDQFEKDSFTIIETKEIFEVNTTDGSKDFEPRTTHQNVKEEQFEIDFKSGDFLYQASGSWAEFDQDDDCFLKGCKWLVLQYDILFKKYTLRWLDLESL